MQGPEASPISAHALINTPLAVLQSVYQNWCAQNPQSTHDVESDWNVPNLVDSTLSAGNSWSQLPFLHANPIENIPPNSLVRLRCMIQDMGDPEFYLGLFEEVDTRTGARTLRTGKYVETLNQPVPQRSDFRSVRVRSDLLQPEVQIDLDAPTAVTHDRQILYCVPIPGETLWVNEHLGAVPRPVSTVGNTGSAAKRQRADADDRISMEMDSVEPNANDSVTHSDAHSNGVETVHSEANKKSRAGEGFVEANGEAILPASSLLPEAFLVKTYHSEGVFKLGDLVEFVGVLSIAPQNDSPDDANEEDAEDAMLLDGLTGLRSTRVPRVHAVVHKKLGHGNPLLHPLPEHNGPLISNMVPHIASVRSQLLGYLTSGLGGDALATEYTLLSLIAQTHTRAGMPVGRFTLNLCNVVRSTTETGGIALSSTVHNLSQMVSSLVPRCCTLPLNVEVLSKENFAPFKDYKTNRLVTGILQLSDGTHLVIDETCLREGQLNVKATANIRALQRLVEQQKLDIDFHYYRTETQMSVPTLVASLGKSFMKCECVIPLADGAVITEPSLPACLLPAEFFRNARLYLALLKQLDATVPQAVAEIMEADFVAKRQANKAYGAEAFHFEISLSRLLAISHGLSTVSADLWTRTKELETARTTRVSAFAPAAPASNIRTL